MAEALDIARATMTDALPLGSPLPGDIRRARFTRSSEITADIIMFDGQPATAHFRKWAHGWSYGWDSLPGGDISLENGVWRRVAFLEPTP